MSNFTEAKQRKDLETLREQLDEVRNTLLPITRGACLEQDNGDRCICYVCTVQDLLSRLDAGKVQS